MGISEFSLAGACALSAAGWSVLVSWRAPGGSLRGAFRALLGGAAACGLALATYEVLRLIGVDVQWDAIVSGGWGSLGMAAAIGLVEESAKLVGIVLAVKNPRRRGAVMRGTVGVAAAFAAIEAAITMVGAAAPVAVARALLAPFAHAILAAPIGFGLAALARDRRRGLVLAPLGLLLSASLHAVGDLSLATPAYGRFGYAAALLAPALWIFLHARRIAPVAVMVGDPGYLRHPGRSR